MALFFFVCDAWQHGLAKRVNVVSVFVSVSILVSVSVCCVALCVLNARLDFVLESLC